MPIPKDEFRMIDEGEPSMLDLSSDTTQGKVYRFLQEHADQAFRQSEIVDAVDIPRGSISPTLSRLEQRGLVEHRDRFWAIADTEHRINTVSFQNSITLQMENESPEADEEATRPDS